MKNFNQKYLNIIKNIMEYVFVIIIILECNSIYSQIYNIHYIIRSLMVITACGVMIVDIFIKLINKKLILYMPILIYIVFDLMCSAIMFFKCDNNTGRFIILMYFVMFIPIFLVYLSNIEYENLRKIGKKLVNIVVIISVISIIFWALGAVFNIIKPLNEIKVVWGRPYSVMDNYYGLYFDSHQDVYWLTNSPIPRNMGIFGEAPMFAVVIMVAMTINLLLFNNELENTDKKRNIINLVTLFMTMISTISITGIGFALIIISFYGINILKKISKKNKIILFGCIIVAIIAMLPIGIQIMNKKASTSSAIHRNMDINNGIKAFMNDPIIGKGINHFRGSETDVKNGYGYSNSIIPVITDGGIILGALYLIPMIVSIINDIYNKNVNKIIIYIMFNVILFTSIVQYRLIMFAIIGILYCLSFKNAIWNEQKIKSEYLNEEY